MHSHISSAALYKWKLLSSSGNGRGNLNMKFRLTFSADHSTFTRSVSASSLFIIKASAQVWSISVGGRMAAVFGYHLSHGLPCLNAFDFGIAVLWLTRSLTAVCFYLSIHLITSHVECFDNQVHSFSYVFLSPYCSLFVIHINHLWIMES